ncbi:MAG TPA: extracellular solute-binding protein [Candidatus Binataceae bacterium]|nr:extracellular solute-binding protein [Candidatus Binataceae bacterium]
MILAAPLAICLAGCRARESGRARLNIALAVFPSEAARYAKFVSAFETAHHVHVNLSAQTYADILQALRVQSASRRGSLDLVELDLAMLGRARPGVAALDDIVSPSVHSLFSEAAWAAATTNQHIYFIPHRLMWQAMVYNRLKVPNPPRTWDELERFARAHPGKLAIKGARYEGAVCDAMAFVWSAGGAECAPGSPGSLRAFDFLRALSPDLNDESAVYREMSVLEAQARGSVWIHFNWPFAIEYLKSKGLAPAVDLSAPIPAGPGGMATPLGGGYLAIPVSAPHPALAREFLKYLLSRQAQARLSRELGWYGSVAPPAGSEDATLYAGFTAMRPYVRARPALECYPQLSNRWQRAIRAVLFGAAAPKAALAAILSPQPGHQASPAAAADDNDQRCCAGLEP